MKTSVMGDPSWGAAIGNIASLFDPKSAAEGSALQARTRNFDAEAGYNNARTGMIDDRRKALANVAALKAAGYSDRQILGMQATQTDRMSDLFAGVQTDEGTQALLKGGDPRVGMTLLGQGAAASKPDFAFTDTRADQLNATAASADRAKAAEVQRLQNAGSLAVAQARPVELTAGSSALFAPGDPRNPNGVAQPLVYEAGKGMPMYRPGAMTSPSQVFTAPAAPGSIVGSGTGRAGNLSADETELLNKMKLEAASGQSIAGWGKYPIVGGTELIDLISAAAREAYPTDTPAVAAAKWKAANGITVDDDWNAFSSNESTLQRGGKPLTTADLFSAPSGSPAAPAGGQPAAPAGAAPVAPGQPAAPAQSATGPERTKTGGIMLDGIPFEPSETRMGEIQHGDEYVGINAKTNKMEVRYFDANKDAAGINPWSTTPVFVGNGDAPDIARIKGDDTYLGIIPKDAAAMNTAPARLIEQGRAAGIIDEAALAEAVRRDGNASKGSYINGGYVRGYLKSLAPQFNAMARTEAMKDPRVAKFAAGDFSGDAGLPDEAMALAEQMGINRAQFGIPEAGLGESLPGGLGAVFAPAGYGAAQETMARGLKEFYRAVQEGRVDPNSLIVRRPAPAQPVAAR